MFEFILDNFRKCKEGKDLENKNHAIKIAACALFLEMVQANGDFSEVEKSKIFDIFKSNFSLTENEINQFISESQEKIKKSVSSYEFTEIVNQNFDNEEKYNLIKSLWHIAFADGNLDEFEDHYIKKIASNLNLSHKDRIAAKLEVKTELGSLKNN